MLSATGDYVFGRGAGEFLVNSPETVAQAVETRLRLITGEWYLDVNEGTPYDAQVLGTGKQDLYDAALRERILGTPGVTRILDYASVAEASTRALLVAAKIETLYGTVDVQQVL